MKLMPTRISLVLGMFQKDEKAVADPNKPPPERIYRMSREIEVEQTYLGDDGTVGSRGPSTSMMALDFKTPLHWPGVDQPMSLGDLFKDHATLTAENLQDKIDAANAATAALQPLSDALPGETVPAKLDALKALNGQVDGLQDQLAQANEKIAAGNAKAADLEGRLAAAQALIRANLLDYDSAQQDLREATAQVNGYIDWTDVRTTANAAAGPWKDEAAALIEHDNVVYAQSAVDAQKAGTSPADWRKSMVPWIYDGTPSKADPTATPAPAPAQE